MRFYQTLKDKKVPAWFGLGCFLILYALGTAILWDPEFSRGLLLRWKWFAEIGRRAPLYGTGVPDGDLMVVALPLILLATIPLILVGRRALEEVIDRTSLDWPLYPSPKGSTGPDCSSENEPAPSLLRRTIGNPGLILTTLGVIVFVYQMRDMAKVGYRPLDFYLWFASMFIISIGTVLWDRNKKVCFRSPLRPWEWIGIFALTIGLFFLYSWDLESWRYSTLGDQGSFFQYANAIINGQISKSPFAQNGVYDKFPVLSSHFQSWIMRIFGIDRVGWLYSSCLVTALAVIPVYVLTRCLFTPAIAFLTSCFMGVNHFQIVFAHLGYNNSQCLLPVFASLAFLVWALRTESRLGFFLSGISAGFGFYTIHTARLGVFLAGVMLVFYLFKGFRLKRILLSLFFALGVVVTLLPTDLSINIGVKDQTILGAYKDAKSDGNPNFPTWTEALKDPIMHNMLKRNVLQTVFLPISYRARTHFVWGTLMDALTGPLSLIGFLYIVVRYWKRGRYCLLLFFSLTGLFAVGVLHRYGEIPTTRVQFAVPFVALFAAFAVEKFLMTLKGLTHADFVRPAFFIRGSLVVVVTLLCTYRVYEVAPNKERCYDCALAWRAAQATGRTVPVYWVIPDHVSPDQSLDLYRAPNPVKIFKNAQKSEVLAELENNPRFLVVAAKENTGWQDWLNSLNKDHPDGWSRTFVDGARQNALLVFGHGVEPRLGRWRAEQ